MDATDLKQRSLDYLGIIEGTNKTSLGMDYLRHYERVLSDLRNQPIQLLEIGVDDGASLRMWEKFLPHATIIGIDLQPICARFAGGRIVVEIGSQADPAFLSALKEKYQPTVIVDDGSHLSEHVFVTLEHLFPCLAPGGIYIIEDVHLHHGRNAAVWHAGGGITPTEYLASAACGLTSRIPDGEAADLAKAIDRIEFIPSAIIIHKASDNDMRDRLDDLFEAAKVADKYLTWFELANVFLKHDDLERAEIAAQRAVTLSLDRGAVWVRLGYVQHRRGKLTEAIEAMRMAVKLDPRDATSAAKLAQLEAT